MSDFFEFTDDELAEISDAEELTAATPGEYLVELTGFVMDDTTGGIVRRDKNGYPYVLPRLEIQDGENVYNDFTCFVPIPSADRDKKGNMRAQKAFKEFTDAFNVQRSTKFDFRSMISEKAWAILGVDEDETFGKKNRLQHWIVGK